MKRLLLTCLVITTLLCACSNEESKIKNGLKETIPAELLSEYDFKSYQILETILDVNLKDSISNYQYDIRTNNEFIQSDSIRLESIINNIKTSKKEKATTLYWLRSSYDMIIRDFEKMKEEIEDKIEKKENQNNEYRKKIKQFEDAIAASKVPIIYYIVKHVYDIKGMRKETIVTLDSNYKPLNSNI